MKKIFFIIIINIFNFLYSENLNALDNCVDFNINTDRKLYYSGENITIDFNINIDKGFHIYSVHPDKSLSSTYTEFNDSLYFNEIGIMLEQLPKKKCDTSFNQIIHYHTGTIKLEQTLKIVENLSPGIYTVSGTLNYLACEAAFCIPKYDDFNFKLNITEGEAREEFIYNFSNNYEQIDIEECSVSAGIGDSLNDEINKGLFSFIIFALGMGFLALLTPCVFPMIPITVSFFTKEGEKENSKPIFSAFIYAFGIIVIFSSLGLILALTLGATGAQDLAQNPWVNLFIAFLFIYFSFSLFGFYEIQIPSSLRQYSLESESKGGILGILFMSLTFTLTSFTCTVQFVGLLLVAASSGEYFWPIIGMLSFSTAFAFPFFFLALFPQYLAKLPKSGGWLNSIKVTMGFLELAAAFKFISNSDLVWDWGIFTRFTVLLIWSILLLLICLYLLGKIKMPHDSKINKISFSRISLSIIFLSLSIYFASGLTGKHLDGLVESYLPPSKIDDWTNTIDEAYILANKTNKPIFIDFTGYTCTNCRWMEVNIFEDSEIKLLFDNFILTKLYTDGKEDINKFNQELEIERFGTAALPFYVVLSPNDKKIATFPGMDTNKQNFIDFLSNALIKFENEDY